MQDKSDRPEWLESLRTGDDGEQRVLRLLKSIGLQARIVNQPGHDIAIAGMIEIKTDARAEETGNAAIEVEYKGNPSGITSTTANVWCHIVGNDCYIIATTRLRELVAGQPARQVGEGASVVLIPLPVLARASQLLPLPRD